MKFTDEEKDEIARVSKTYWREIIIITLFVGTVFCYWRWNETKKDLAEAVRISTMKKTVDDINSGTADVTKRELETYPKMQETITKLNNDIASLKTTITRLQKNALTKEQTNEIFRKQSANEISKWFTTHGYPNTVSTSNEPRAVDGAELKSRIIKSTN